MGKLILSILSMACLLISACAKNDKKVLVIAQQGSFAVGGTVIQNSGTFDNYKFEGWVPSGKGQTYHGDHAVVFYQIPDKARKLPLVFLHGYGQASRTWGTTPDGREGFNNIFARRKFSVYLIDQPRRGQAGRGTVEAKIAPVADEQTWFDIWRMGIWPDFAPNVQFPKDKESLNQFFRQMTPNIGPIDNKIVIDSVSALFDKIGDGILVTHSAGGSPGWAVRIKNGNVKAIVAYEPGGFPFPADAVPESVSGKTGTVSPEVVAVEDFNRLMQIPIIIYFGDYIPDEPSANLGAENWRVRLAMARKFAEIAKSRGGDVTLVELPKIGIYGNTHFLFAELNNAQLADLLSKWLKEKGLDNLK
ncbi:MAG: alpha/beta fold hydrolase [Elusimicrobiota bacterium]|jgi:pimeloyl-ACP methyl ester carboxylesterase|nr:alpha/beta fold hydrolase [Elusimicrobiota bacterium]